MRCRRFVSVLLVAGALLAAASPAAAQGTYLRLDGAATGDGAGLAVAAAGDVNGDGRPDLLVGAPSASPLGRDHAGSAYLVLGPLAPGVLDLGVAAPNVIAIAGARPQGLAGSSVAAAGDVNGDGLGDIVIGAPGVAPNQEGGAQPPGRAYVVLGSRSPAALDLAGMGTRGFAIVGERRPFPDAFGWSVSGVGDVDGDRLDDVAIAAPGNEGFEDDYARGRAYAVFGSRSRATVRAGALGRRGIRWGGGSTGGMRAIAPAGDVDGDGHADVVVGDTVAARGFGGAYVLLGSRAARRQVTRLGRHGFVIRGVQKYADAGYAVAGGTDLNGDGRPDVVLTAPQGHRSHAHNTAAGGAWIVFGRRPHGTIELADLGARGRELRGRPADWAGFAVAIAGTVDGDRVADVSLLAGGSVAVLRGRPGSGATRLDRLTPADGFFIDGHLEPGDFYSTPGAGGLLTVGAGADFDGDGRADVVAGAGAADHNERANSGSAYVFFDSAAS